MKNAMVLLVALLVLSGCSGYSTPGSNHNEPDATGNWSISFIPSAPFAGAPSPSGVVLGVTLSQNAETLSGTVTSVTGEPSTCFPNLSIAGTTFTLSGQLTPPVEAGANLFLTLSFGPTGNAAFPTSMLNLQGALNPGSTSGAGVFVFPAATSGCTQGTFNISKA